MFGKNLQVHNFGLRNSVTYSVHIESLRTSSSFPRSSTVTEITQLPQTGSGIGSSSCASIDKKVKDQLPAPKNSLAAAGRRASLGKIKGS